MLISKLDNNGDWSFGRNLDDYIVGAEAIAQNIKTRVRSFANDWFLDITANIDWDTILGIKNNGEIIQQEIRRVVAGTQSVVNVREVYVTIGENRKASITLSYDDIYTVSNRLGFDL